MENGNGNGNQQLLSPSPAHDMDRMSAPDGSREHVAARRDRRTVPPSALKKQTWWWPGAAAHSRWQRGSGTTPEHTRIGQVRCSGRCRRRRTNARDATARPRTWRRRACKRPDDVPVRRLAIGPPYPACTPLPGLSAPASPTGAGDPDDGGAHTVFMWRLPD